MWAVSIKLSLAILLIQPTVFYTLCRGGAFSKVIYALYD